MRRGAVARASGPLRVRACAKINLTLQILGVRADGYHELRTTFQSLALHDTLTFTATDGPFEIITDDPECPTDRTNLVWRAADHLSIIIRNRKLDGVRVRIQKRIPARAGLGGGSSDAAATLRALRVFWGLELDDDALHGIATMIGADVPFFLDGGTALGVERGDVLFQLAERPPAFVVIARPNFGVSTKDAYAWWDEQAGTSHTHRPRQPRTSGNDLQAAVVARFPRIAALVRALERQGATAAAMSGSGSAVFGVFSDRDAADRAARALRNRRVETWVTRTLSRREYVRQAAIRTAGGVRR